MKVLAFKGVGLDTAENCDSDRSTQEKTATKLHD